MPMSPKEVATTWFDSVWNRKDPTAIDRYLAPDAKMHGLGETPLTLADFKQLHRTFCAAFPDIRIEVVRTVSEGDMIVVLGHVTGTHTGADLGAAPTQKRIEMWGMGMARVANDQIVEGWNSWDFMSLYQQVGMLPALASK
jgi:predicted ester cyclase